MEATVAVTLRGQLADRRQRLQAAITKSGQLDDLVRLLMQVDSALTRMDAGAFGRCDVCGDSVEDGSLLDNPFMQYCLCRLDSKQLDALQHDLDLAQRIQAGLLPLQDIRSGGWVAHYRYEAAGPVSGDYCDIVSGQNGHAAKGPGNGRGDLHFAMADVSGKGVAAALLMAHLNASFRSLIQVGLPLAEIVARQNRLLLETRLPSHYATMVCGRADSRGRVEICNAGHCPPLIARGSEVTTVAPTGFPVGMVDDRSYAVVMEELGPGDTLLLYTDGLIEGRNKRDEEFGVARVVDLLRRHSSDAPRALADRCLMALSEFAGTAVRNDDLSLMVLRRER